MGSVVSVENWYSTGTMALLELVIDSTAGST